MSEGEPAPEPAPAAAPLTPDIKVSPQGSIIQEDKAKILRKRLCLRKRPEDVDYINVTANIFKNMIHLEKQDRKRLHVWIDKLEQQRETSTIRQSRNEYARYLDYTMQDNTLHYPFNEPPPEEDKLKNLEDVMESCEEELGLYKEFRAKQGGHYP